jgi:hypothetical protein
MQKISTISLAVILISVIHYAHGAADRSVAKNHEFKEVKINYRTGDACSYQYSPVDFCDDRHISAIKDAIEKKRPNFNHHYILLPISERNWYRERSLVAIDVETGVAYPFPFDSYFGYQDAKGNVHSYGRLSYSLDSNRVCVSGSILAYKETDSGKLCWKFEDGKFIGHRTPYTDE